MPASDTSILRPSPPREGRLSTFTHRFATPLITGLFTVSAVSGTALFFHWSQGGFHEMHEWLSMVLLVPFGLHLWKNWRSLLGYAKRKTLLVPLAASLLVALPFAVSGQAGGRGGNPALKTIALMTGTPLSDLAPVLKTTPDALLAALKRQGYQARSADETLNTVAAASGKQAPAILFAVMPER